MVPQLQLCIQHPFIWFTTDESGGWAELQNKLILHDLEYKGKGVPKKREAVLDNVRTYHASCLKEASVDFPCPTEPLTYSNLIALLRQKGIISSYQAENPENVEEVIRVHNQQV